MDESRAPGILLTGIFAERIRFDDIPAGATKPDNLVFSIRIDRRRLSPQRADVAVQLALRPREASSSAFLVDVTVVGQFETDPTDGNMTLDDFVRVNGPAIVMPYVREVVSSVTGRSRHGHVPLPPINVAALVAPEASPAKRG
jgi:preprotein translocase subunit SecB